MEETKVEILDKNEEEEVTVEEVTFSIKETYKKCITYLKQNKYQTFLYVFLGLVVIGIFISLLQLKN